MDTKFNEFCSTTHTLGQRLKATGVIYLVIIQPLHLHIGLPMLGTDTKNRNYRSEQTQELQWHLNSLARYQTA